MSHYLVLISLLLFIIAVWWKQIPIGTRSVLIGAHCFFIHPWFVAFSWYKLYGFPKDIRLWVAFFVHDLGYWGCPNMDGEEGELHPYLGANIMHKLFDSNKKYLVPGCQCEYCSWVRDENKEWYNFTLYHSRFLAKKNGKQYSKLCVADKLAIINTPSWLYIPMVTLTGEVKEYMKDFNRNCGGSSSETIGNDKYFWYSAVKKYVSSWVEEHKDIKVDNWTPEKRQPVNSDGVWK